MFARSRFQIGPSKQLQNNRCLALRRPPSCARQRRRFRRLLSRPPGSFRSPGIGSLCVGHAFPPSEHFLYKCSQRAVQRNSGPGEMERMMKVQDVLLKAMAKRITWWEAAEIIGVTDRTMRRWRERLEEHGYSGLADRRKGKVSFRRVALKTCEEVLRLYREKYFDFSIRHFHEKLQSEHNLELSYTWVQQALQGAGLVKRRSRRGPHRRRRERRPLPGMLLHIDGSKHRWLKDDRWYDLSHFG